MANSYVQYYGNGTRTLFNVTFPYIAKSDVVVKVDGSNVSFTWVNSTTVSLPSAPALNSVVEVRRITQNATPQVDFQDGAIVTEDQLNTNAEQALFAVQEARDYTDDSTASTVRASSSEHGNNFVLPDPATRSGKFLAFGSDGKTLNMTNPVVGPQGAKGDTGASFSPNAGGLLTGRAAYNGSGPGFSYVASDTGLLYFKNSSTSGDWSSGYTLGSTGAKGDKGDKGDVGYGVAAGGTSGQVLVKQSGTNYDTAFGQVDNIGIANDAVRGPQIKNSEVTFAKLAADAGNAKGARTVSTSAASGGGTDGDIWYQV